MKKSTNTQNSLQHGTITIGYSIGCGNKNKNNKTGKRNNIQTIVSHIILGFVFREKGNEVSLGLARVVHLNT